MNREYSALREAISSKQVHKTKGDIKNTTLIHNYLYSVQIKCNVFNTKLLTKYHT